MSGYDFVTDDIWTEMLKQYDFPPLGVETLTTEGGYINDLNKFHYNDHLTGADQE